MASWHNSNEWYKARAYAKTVLEPICQHCNKELIGEDWTIDHIVAAGQGEPNHDISNLQSLCRQCNGRKQDRAYVRTNYINPRYK